MNINHAGQNNCTSVSIGNLTLFFSYAVCIAYNYCHPVTGEQVTGRCRDNYSVTTAKHYTQLGCVNYPKYSEEQLHANIAGLIADMGVHGVLQS